jgi:hypothetical protein
MQEDFAEREFGGAELGDGRLSSRLVRMAAAALAKPGASLPEMMGTDAELEATYRFLNHPRIEPEQVLAPHVRRTVERCSARPLVVVAHDTTDLMFGGESERENLGRVRNKKAGFEAHMSIAVEPGREARHMLGVLEVQRVNGHTSDRSGPGGRSLNGDDRWFHGVRSTQVFLGGVVEAVHVMDRASDSYQLWARMVAAGYRFVCRLSKNRKLAPTLKLFEHLADLAEQPAQLHRRVVLSRRGKQRGSVLRKSHPARDRRNAQLEVRASRVAIPMPDYCRGQNVPPELQLNIVHVREVNTPEGCDPVDWKFITTEPIDEEQLLADIVDAYRARWVIEEYFKALKTGCAIEKRQLESYEGLAMVLALLAPVAWRLLQLRALAEAQPDRPAADALTPLQLRILRVKSRDPFPDNPTVADACFAVARLGGFLKHNRRPGWQVLARGFHDLLLMEEGASALSGS